MRLTAVGIRNYQDKVEARQDQREKTIMDLYAKGGPSTIRKLFGKSTIDNRGINLFDTKKSNTDDLESTNKNLDIADIEMSYLDTPNLSTKNLAIAENLIENFGMNPNAVARLAIDPTSFERLAEYMSKLSEQFSEKKFKEMTKEMAAQEIGNILDTAIFKQGTTSGKLDMSAIEKYVGRELDVLYKTILQEEQLSSGAVVFPERVLVETPDPSKIPGFIKSALSSPYNRALQEQGFLRRELAKFTALTDQGTNLSPSQENEKQWYVERNKEVTRAINEFKKDRFGELAYIYGGSFLQDMLKNYASYEELAPIQELISVSEDAPPIRIPANVLGGQDPRDFLNYLIQKRILRVGDQFILYDPTTNNTILQDYITE
tara:strand:+ start:2723 stop:3847 length:1125 start_codon:yes stop_codon:yes gene_type:complete